MQTPSDLEKLIVGGFLGVLIVCAMSTAAHGFAPASRTGGLISAPGAAAPQAEDGAVAGSDRGHV